MTGNALDTACANSKGLITAFSVGVIMLLNCSSIFTGTNGVGIGVGVLLTDGVRVMVGESVEDGIVVIVGDKVIVGLRVIVGLGGKY